MSMGTGQLGKGSGEGESRQALVTIREAAQLAGVSTKQVRRWITEGKCHGEQGQTRYGPTWFVDAATLPRVARPLPAAGLGLGEGEPFTETGDLSTVGQAPGGVPAALLTMLQDLQRRHEGAVARLGQLEGEREHRLMLEARANSLVEAEAKARAEAAAARERAADLARQEQEARVAAEAERQEKEHLAREVARLKTSTRWWEIAALVGVVAAVIAVAAAWLAR